MHLFSNRLQMTSNCGKNRKVAQKVIAALMLVTNVQRVINCECYNKKKYGMMSRYGHNQMTVL